MLTQSTSGNEKRKQHTQHQSQKEYKEKLGRKAKKAAQEILTAHLNLVYDFLKKPENLVGILQKAYDIVKHLKIVKL